MWCVQIQSVLVPYWLHMKYCGTTRHYHQDVAYIKSNFGCRIYRMFGKASHQQQYIFHLHPTIYNAGFCFQMCSGTAGTSSRDVPWKSKMRMSCHGMYLLLTAQLYLNVQGGEKNNGKRWNSILSTQNYTSLLGTSFQAYNFMPIIGLSNSTHLRQKWLIIQNTFDKISQK